MASAAVFYQDLPASGRRRKRQSRWRQLLTNRLSLLGVVLLLLLALGAAFGSAILHRLLGLEPNTLSCLSMEPPSAKHPLGCDPLGRDIVTRLLDGGRVSLLIGVTVACCTTALGLLVGMIAGYIGGLTDSILMRITDTLLAMPTFFIILAAAAFLGPSIITTIIIIGLTQWMATARLVRSECLAIREREYILAARAVGLSHLGIMRHILPNILGTLSVVATLAVASGILTESALSYLGLGIQPPYASWGSMLSNAQNYIFVAPLQGIFPGALIMLTVLAVNFVGEGIREALDPRLLQR